MTEALILPIFPLSVVQFPGLSLPLHVFEERYKQLVADCLAHPGGSSASQFGVSLLVKKQLKVVGCSVTIERVLKRHEDGRLDILTKGERRFRIVQMLEEKPYLRAKIEYLDDLAETVEPSLREQTFSLHAQLINTLTDEMPNPEALKSTNLAYLLANAAGIELALRQQLLEMVSETKRLQLLCKYYQQVIPQAIKKRDTKVRVQSNGHFKKAPELPKS